MLTAAEAIEEMKRGQRPQDVYVCVVSKNNWHEVEAYCDTAVRLSESGISGVKNRNGGLGIAGESIVNVLARAGLVAREVSQSTL